LGGQAGGDGLDIIEIRIKPRSMRTQCEFRIQFALRTRGLLPREKGMERFQFNKVLMDKAGGGDHLWGHSLNVMAIFMARTLKNGQ
jgi:hypothetical protein